MARGLAVETCSSIVSGRTLLFGRAAVLFSGLVGIGVMVLQAWGSAEPPAGIVTSFFIFGMGGVILSSLLLSVIFHGGTQIYDGIDRSRVVSRILWGLETACWTGVLGLAGYTSWVILAGWDDLGSFLGPGYMIATMMLPTLALTSFLAVFIALLHDRERGDEPKSET